MTSFSLTKALAIGRVMALVCLLLSFAAPSAYSSREDDSGEVDIGAGFIERGVKAEVERETRRSDSGSPERTPLLDRDWGASPAPAPAPAPPSDGVDALEVSDRERSYSFCSGTGGSLASECRQEIVSNCEAYDPTTSVMIDLGDGELGYGCQYEPEVEEIAEVVDPEIAAQEDMADILEQLPGEVQRAFATLPIAGGSVQFEPDLLGFGYRNRHTHMFADVDSQTLYETLLGIPVEIRVNPQSFLWDYGDGSSRVTYDPGEPMPDSWQGAAVVKTNQETPTSHVYTETGRFPVGLNTTFVGEYRVGGGPWIVIPGSVDVQASPGEADIWRVAARNVSGSCRNTVDWGCNGPVTLEPGDTPPKIFADQYEAEGNSLGN